MLPPMLLGAFGFMIGLLPNLIAQPLVSAAVAAVGHDGSGIYLKLWHGFQLPFFLSVVTLAVGSLLFIFRNPLTAAFNRDQLARYGPASGYAIALDGLKAIAKWQTLILQNGRLRTYLLIVLLSFCGLVATTLWAIEFPSSGEWLDWRLHEVGLTGLILAGAWMAVRSTSRLAAVCATRASLVTPSPCYSSCLGPPIWR